MPSPSTIGLFAVAALALLVIPGPSVLYIVTRSATQGRRAGLISVLGIHTGSIVHVAAAATGLSALLLASATAFSAVKLVGAAYLIYLGVTRLLSRAPEEAQTVEPATLRRVYGEGVVVNVLNPKTALFFVAFLPQFVAPDRGSVALQVVVLGLLFILLGMLSDSTYALVAGTVGARLRSRAKASEKRWRPRWSGLVLIGLGIVAATARRPATTS